MLKKIVLPIFLIFLLLAFILSACGTEAAPAATVAPAPVEATATSAPVESSATAEQATEAPAATAIPETTTVADATGVSFANDVMPIFEARCIRCHGGERVSEGLDLRTYDSLFAGSEGGQVVLPGDAANSELVKQIVSGKMPKRAAKLSPEQIQLITDWVNAGAPNN